MEIKKISVEDAVGNKLNYDLTQITPNEFKGARFKKGHIIKKEDIPLLKKMGKEHIYFFDLDEEYLHEDEAAYKISQAIVGEGISLTEPEEGKIHLRATNKGLLKIKKEMLFTANKINDVLITTGHNNTPVEEGTNLAGVRVNPLVVEKEKIEELEYLMRQETMIEVLPFNEPKVGILVTGNEVYSGKIEDKFVPKMKEKISKYGGKFLKSIYVPDDKEKIKKAILDLKEKGAELVVISGGMSVDADDLTPMGIKDTGAEVISYGAPVLPGNKLMLAYLRNLPIVGVPAAVIFYDVTILDLIYPRLLAGEKITKEDIIKLSHGGLCHHCEVCQYPRCSFGKGS